MERGPGIHQLDQVLKGSVASDGILRREKVEIDGDEFNYYTGEFWTARQRQSSSLHEISYRACFKGQLPRFFIANFTDEKSIVFDPFNGRGTTMIESALNGRVSVGMDINPLSELLTFPRLNIPPVKDVFERLDGISFDSGMRADIDLSMFYHRDTEAEISSLRNYLISRAESGKEDSVDRWIRMVATNRLSGHSPGFFSVYTLPPNQATTQEEQRRINDKTGRNPEYREVRKLIKKKTLSLLRSFHGNDSLIAELNRFGEKSSVLTVDTREASRYLDENTVDLTVTSPPFLNIVQYARDNWLRCWFNAIDTSEVEKRIFLTPSLDKWRKFVRDVLKQIYVATRYGGHVAFEVGEVRGGKLNLDEYVARDGLDLGFEVEGIMINSQKFTKTSNIWGVSNQTRGTNTNRIVVLRKTME